MASPPLIPEWERVSHPNSKPYYMFTMPIHKSRQDDREYRIIQLENGLQAMLVHDAKADKAAASLDVSVGHLYDPDDMPGLAHFCEHLLFMGTEQYPRENEYSEYLAKNNGNSNAFTGTSNTNYYFSVSTDALPGALSRFAAFFHCPLFAPSCTSRELNAVDSEHKKNHQADMWRIFQLNKHLTKPGHPWSKFGSGNRDSLSKVGRELKAKGLLSSNGASTPLSATARSVGSSLAATPESSRVPSPAPSSTSANSEMDADGGSVGRETRRRLVEWWSKEYCAGRMRLCVIGKESLDELANMVSNLFTPTPNRGQNPLPMINDHPFGPNEMGTLVSVQTIMSFHAVEVSFPLPWQPRQWRYQPGSFLTHFLGHEGPGSLHSYLKNKGWVTALSAGPQNLGRGFAMLKVTLSLTKTGFEHHQEVVLAVYKYLSMLRASKLPAWYQREMSIIKATRFRFAEKRKPDDYAVWVTEHLSWPVPRELVLSAPQLVWEWDEKDPINNGEGEMREVLNSLRVESGRVVLMAKAEEHERVRGPGGWKTEPWYGTPYRVERLDEEFVREAEAPNNIPELFLPGPNEFIPTNLDVEKRPVDQPMKRPLLIRDTPLTSLWHKKDDQFWVPRAHVLIDIRSPEANVSARASVMTRLFSDLVNDSLTEFSYDAELAGLTYNFSPQTLGMSVVLSGYNDKLHVLAKDVIEKVKNLQLRPDRLEVMKDQAKRDYENFFMGAPFRLVDYYGRHLLTEQQWILSEKLAEVSTITIEELEEHVQRLLSQLHMRMLVVGNMYKDDAVRLAAMTEDILQPAPLNPLEVVDTALILSDGSNHVWQTVVPNVNEPNSAITYYLHVGSFLEPRLRVTSALLTQILSEPAFNVLRTREQLGYIVSCSQMISPGESDIGLRIVIQSERGPVYLEERIEAFLDEMKDKLEEISDAELKEQQVGLERRWREAVKNLGEETNRYWTHIDSGYLDFLRRDHDASLVKSITKQEVISLFMSRIHQSSSSRAKMSVHLRSQKPRPKKIGLVAMEAFENTLIERGIKVNGQKWREELTGDGEPLLSQFTKYWQGTLPVQNPSLTPEASEQIMACVPGLLEQYPADSDYEGKIKDGVHFIEDPKAFKASLRRADPPRPLVQWDDLPMSKY
ncbi:insulin-degrading enzyme [Laetiporus sulphureus 93-53]|uniref:Insulin-degrading enzyme n=1 Tax=Laetiporus sulphureus 93-53 TaxID=1314785 RepID=A0A165C734_9APHY|nr:insulin-degrading enzyme [Laetiporus sulphureus 93-53]KZT02312.1 insulin-degrading enzyme [Laetiporus sulphureus 93-53]